MTKTITQLFNGNLEPIRYLGKNNQELHQSEKLIQRNLEQLEKSLNESQKQILQKLTDNINEYFTLLAEQAFCDGFCLGTKITVESLTGAEQLL